MGGISQGWTITAKIITLITLTDIILIFFSMIMDWLKEHHAFLSTDTGVFFKAAGFPKYS